MSEVQSAMEHVIGSWDVYWIKKTKLNGKELWPVEMGCNEMKWMCETWQIVGFFFFWDVDLWKRKKEKMQKIPIPSFRKFEKILNSFF